MFVLARLVPAFEAEYARLGWTMFPSTDRVYVDDKARAELGWEPRYGFKAALARLRAHEDHRSPLAQAIGFKGDHATAFAEGPHPVG